MDVPIIDRVTPEDYVFYILTGGNNHRRVFKKSFGIIK